jgi:predicted ester cyclase
MSKRPAGAYGADNDIVDYILGITFEIWEEGHVDLIDQYYSKDTVVYSLDGITHGSRQMIEATRSMLKAYPDRLLLGDDVICSGNSVSGYSSHRVLSPMTNTGSSAFGPATGRSIRIMNMADCVVENGVITREWLARDNHALVVQLGFDVTKSARCIADRHNDDLRKWIRSESERIDGYGLSSGNRALNIDNATDFARQIIGNNWFGKSPDLFEQAYAPYAVLHRSPVQLVSGRDQIVAHFAGLRAAFQVSGASIDHVALQALGTNGQRIAVRWTVAGKHVGDYLGLAATNKRVLIMGVTHWRVIDGRVAVEWTVFDSLAVLSQLIEP